MMFKRSPLLLDAFDTPVDAPFLPERLSGCFINTSSSKTTSQNTSNPVVNQPGLDMLNQNAQNAQGVVNSTFQPYNQPMSADMTQVQNQAGNLLQAAPYMGAGAIGQGVNAAANVAGYQAPMIGGFNANPASAGNASLMSPSTAGTSYFNPVSGTAATTGPAAKMTAASINTNNIPNVSGPSAGLQGIGGYFDPYVSYAVQNTMNDLNHQNQQALNQTNQYATTENAYGGDRQAVADALTNEAYGRIGASTIANDYNTGFQNAAGLLQNNQQMGINAQEANQQAQLAAEEQNAQMQQQAQLVNAGATNQTAQFNATNQQQAMLANTGYQNAAASTNAGAANTTGYFNATAQNAAAAANQGAQNQFQFFNAGNQQQTALANQAADLSAGQGNQSASIGAAGVDLQGAGVLGNLGTAQNTNFLNGTNALGAFGTQQQQTQQNYLTNLYNEFLRQQQYPFLGQQLVNQSMGLVPATLGNASQGTSSGSNSSFGISSPFGSGGILGGGALIGAGGLL